MSGRLSCLRTSETSLHCNSYAWLQSVTIHTNLYFICWRTILQLKTQLFSLFKTQRSLFHFSPLQNFQLYHNILLEEHTDNVYWRRLQIAFGTDRKRMCDFLLASNSNFSTNLHRCNFSQPLSLNVVAYINGFINRSKYKEVKIVLSNITGSLCKLQLHYTQY